MCHQPLVQWFEAKKKHVKQKAKEANKSELEYEDGSLFPECVARVPVSFGGLGVRLCSRKVVSMFATVRNRPQPFA